MPLSPTRRAFMAQATGLLGTAGLSLTRIGARSARADAPARPAGQAPVVALIGAGGVGPFDLAVFMGQGCPVVAICDVDDGHAGKAGDAVEKQQGRRPETFRDFRQLLERKDIDAVIISTPDHWHALIAIHACAAGKDVYLEKPIGHNITEGRAIVAAARKHDRVVQVGTWQRSTREFLDAIDYVRSGKLGRVTTCSAWKTDANRMGRNAPKDPPRELDYDFWVGPAEMVPYTEKNCHGTWRYFFNAGGGTTCDWGVHMIDIALLGMSPDANVVMPRRVSSHGGHLAFPEDDRTTPDTQVTIFEFPKFVLHWEVCRRGFDGTHDEGTQFTAADGATLTVWRGGWKIQGPDGRELPLPPAPEPPKNGLIAHVEDSLTCIRSRERPRSDIASMDRTTTVCHLANAAYLAGTTVRWDEAAGDIAGDAGRDTLSYRREYRKPWALPAPG